MNNLNFDGGPPGNKYAKKLDTPELRQYAYKSYCDHLSKGKDKKSWNLKKPVTLTWETMEKYIRDDPVEFDQIYTQIAESEGLKVWEQVVEDIASGKQKEGNVAALQMKMRCKFGWDRPQHFHHDDNMVLSVQHNQMQILDQMNQMQETAKGTITIEVQGIHDDTSDTQAAFPLPSA